MEVAIKLRAGEEIRYISGFEHLERLNKIAVGNFNRSIHYTRLLQDHVQREQGREWRPGDAIKDVNFLIVETFITPEDYVRCEIRWGGKKSDTFWLDMSLDNYHSLPLWNTEETSSRQPHDLPDILVQHP